jgi:uncharacterized membrane protein (DUF4010 family)
MQSLPQAWIAMSEALLIGLLVGVEREADKRVERHAGLRDFITIGLMGGLCGLLNQTWLTVGGLFAVAALLVVFRFQATERTGITTEFAALATFLLCVLTATPNLPWGPPLAIAVSVVLALFLDAREPLRKFFVETITEREFQDTLLFLAVIFVILPVLPDGGYGPYEFFNPRRVWIFVILVCSISWLGYFLEKFLGQRAGLTLTGVLGGIASTTAATSALARQCAEEPARTRSYAHATVLANAVLCPRVFVLIVVALPALAWSALPMLAAMLVAGFATAWLLKRGEQAVQASPVGLRNPFSLRPALKFGLLFAAVRLLVRGFGQEFGQGGALWASALGGTVDVDAIVFSLPGLVRDSKLTVEMAVLGVMIAIQANALLKTGLAYSAGGRHFGRLVLSGFVVMLIAGAAAMAVQRLL